MLANVNIWNVSRANPAWFKAVCGLLLGFIMQVVFAILLRDCIKTISPATSTTRPRCKAFLIKLFLPLPIRVSPPNIATVMKNLPPVTTNEKFVQYNC